MKSIVASVFVLLSTLLCGTEPILWSLTDEGIRLSLAPGAYVYAEGLALHAEDASGREVALQSPTPAIHDGISVYEVSSLLWRGDRAIARASVTFQGCKEGSCLLPQTLALSRQDAGEKKNGTVGVDGFTVCVKEGYMDVPEFLAFLRGSPEEAALPTQGFWLSLVLIIIGGMGLNLTPCVLPMIPVNLAIIGAEGGRRGLVRAAIYGAGMTLAYGSLGLLVLFAGLRFGALNSHWFFNGVVAGLFFVLGLSLFDLFSLDFSRAQNRIRVADSRTGPLWGVLLLGAVAALLAGACVAPVVMGTLLYAAELCSAGKPYGALLPFVLGFGMALPWPFAGYGLKILPKPGAYMVRIKQGFGVLILLFALYYGYTAIRQFPWGNAPAERMPDMGEILSAARRENRTVCLEFTASWCKNCAAMQRTTLQDNAVKGAQQEIIFVPVPAENLHEPKTEKLLSRFGIRGLPAFVLLTPEAR